MTMADLKGIPALFMRGGTSSGPYWNARDLPADPTRRDAVLLAALGTTDGLSDEVDSSQLSGVGGATPVTSKTAILSRSDAPGVDVDYLFGQVDLNRAFVDTNPSCGNILSAVGHAALEMGLVAAGDPETRITIRNTNTGSLMEAVLQTPGGRWSYLGNARIDGVAGTAAPVLMNFLDVVGSKTGKMFPTGQRSEDIDDLTVSLIDVAVPMIWFRAAELGLTGNEDQATLNAPDLLARMEAARMIASERMGLGDARGKVVPKMGIASPAQRRARHQPLFRAAGVPPHPRRHRLDQRRRGRDPARNGCRRSLDGRPPAQPAVRAGAPRGSDRGCPELPRRRPGQGRRRRAGVRPRWRHPDGEEDHGR